MPPPGVKRPKQSSTSSPLLLWKGLTSKLTVQNAKRLVFDPDYSWLIACVLLLAECLVCAAVINRVKYTEIDWVAYMQEVEGVVNGTFDYSQLKGDTGPLVYPAGFVWLFMGLYYITSHGTNIVFAQCLFSLLYVATLALVFRILCRTKKVPPFIFAVISCTSYRIHSIFILRLFNDPVALFLLYAAINLFMDNHWSLGSLMFSLAVSVKMNILLYAPALLLAYLAILGPTATLQQLTICAGTQLLLAVPFLVSNPINYIVGAFNLGRVFLFQWTVNWRFLPEELFVSRYFHVLLLFCHLSVLIYCAPHWWKFLLSYKKLEGAQVPIVSQLLVLPLFMSNFIGMVFARSLHYQFYVWYYHTLHYLAWTTPFSTSLRLLLLGCLELCWNTYPSTDLSSGLLHCCHLALLGGLIYNMQKASSAYQSAEKEE